MKHADTLVTAPPYSTDMPLEVYQTYFVIDSLCRMESFTSQLFDQLLSTMPVSSADSLLKYIYLVKDYDGIRFKNYLLLSKYIRPDYYWHPHSIYLSFLEYCWKHFQNEQAFDMLLAFADGIYEIEIKEVYNSVVPVSVSGRTLDFVCLTASVHDVIKGQYLLSACPSGEDGSVSYLPCIQFSYANEWVLRSKSGLSRSAVLIVVDSSSYNPETGEYENFTEISLDTFSATHSPQIGDRYLLFTEINMDRHTDNNGVPYHITPFIMTLDEGGLFKIDNGILHDTYNYFGYGANNQNSPVDIAVSDVKQKIRNTITNHILWR